MTKMHQELVKIARKLRCFLFVYRIYSLEIFEGGMAPSSRPPGYATACFAKVTPAFVSTNYR